MMTRLFFLKLTYIKKGLVTLTYYLRLINESVKKKDVNINKKMIDLCGLWKYI